jgi:2-amino-4-hydroxy-6-hydroxymethyldihydropteridine diphosphokinase
MPQTQTTALPATQRVYIGLGANLGDPNLALDSAIVGLKRISVDGRVFESPRYRSAPIEANGPDYLNSVAAFVTGYDALKVLKHLQQLEEKAGRVRTHQNAPRTLDLDLLLYGIEQIDAEHLTVPHPRITERAFVLFPLIDLAPNIMIPGQGYARVFLEGVQHQAIERCLKYVAGDDLDAT